MSGHTTIHSTAIVDSSSQVGEGVTIGAYSIVGSNVILKDNVKVGPHVVIDGYTTIGEGSILYQFSSIGAAPQDLKYHGEPSTLVIGKNNTIREFVTIQPGTKSGGMETVIGDKNLFMANSHVGHDCKVGNNNVIANSCALAGHVTIENNTILGGLSAIHQFAKIGSFAMLGGGAMVSADVPPYCIAQGDRAKLRGVNVIGLERAGYSKEEISAVRKAYRHLFISSGSLTNKLESLPQDISQFPLVKSLIFFISNAERGICSSAKSL